MKLGTIARAYATKLRPNAEAELDWFRHQPNLQEAIRNAAFAVNSNGKRYSHQRRLKSSTLEQAYVIMSDNIELIEDAQDFGQLIRRLEMMLENTEGIGELYIYDTALRLGAYLGFLPQKVYLHAGARTGARKLGLDYRAPAIEVSSVPEELRGLAPHEIEDVLCIFKDDFDSLDVERLIQRSWCA